MKKTKVSYEDFVRILHNQIPTVRVGRTTKRNLQYFVRALQKDINTKKYKTYRQSVYNNYAKQYLDSCTGVSSVSQDIQPISAEQKLMEAIIELADQVIKEKVEKEKAMLIEENKKLKERLATLEQQSLVGMLRRHFEGR